MYLILLACFWGEKGDTQQINESVDFYDYVIYVIIDIIIAACRTTRHEPGT